MNCTILGAKGFIGAHLAAQLKMSGHECFLPPPHDQRIFEEPLGHVFYCIGMTADFRTRPFDTARAHVCLLADVLERARFDTLLYLSSTRVYARAATSGEDQLLNALPADPNDYYNLTKMTGEALCFASKRTGVRIARLSNVFGADLSSENFLGQIIRAAIEDHSVLLETSLDSEKDYVSIRDVIDILPRIAFSGQARIYNVAAGWNTSNTALLHTLSELTGCTFKVRDGAPTIRFPPIDVSRLSQEFQYKPASVLAELHDVTRQYHERKHDKH